MADLCQYFHFCTYSQNYVVVFFLLGVEVDYKGHMDGFPSGKMIIRLLLLLWTGDHPAQCKICKSKGAGGKKGCRRCKLVSMF